MYDIRHRITIDAPAERVHELLTTADGVSRWWTGRPPTGDLEVGGRFGLFFGDADAAAAEMDVVTDTAEHVGWLVATGPQEWVDTTVTFDLRADSDDRTTLLFTHAGWRAPTEFLSGCSTNWGAYLTGLKHGVETGSFAPFPASEISRWD